MLQPWYQQRFAPARDTFLCQTGDIRNGETREFRFGGESPFAFRMFVFNDHGKFKAYRNACPHFDVPLNHEPGQLCTPDNRYFMCMTHHATFDKGSGLCVGGPCEGESLEVIPLRQHGDQLMVGRHRELISTE